jgi:hypothetical protein
MRRAVYDAIILAETTHMCIGEDCKHEEIGE